MTVNDSFRSPIAPVEFPCPICRCTTGPLGCDQERAVKMKFADTSTRREKPADDLDYRATLFGYCPRHGDFSLSFSNYGEPNYHDFIAYEAEKKSLIHQICGRLSKLIEELSR